MNKQQNNNIIELNISGTLDSEGRGVGRFDGRVVFVGKTIPGEAVLARMTKDKKNYAEAELLEVKMPSLSRIKPACPHFGSCGGCALLHMDYSEQLRQKQAMVESALQRIGGFKDIKIENISPAKRQYYYRNRIQLQVQKKDGSWQLGFFYLGSHKVCQFAECLLLPAVFNEIAAFLRSKCCVDFPDGLRQIVLQANNNLSEISVGFVGDGEADKIIKTAAKLIDTYEQIKQIYLNFTGKTYVLWGAEKLHDNIGGLDFYISPGAFVQVNSDERETMLAHIIKSAALTGKEQIFDIYCGSGAISLPLAAQLTNLSAKSAEQGVSTGRAIGVESYAAAVEAAKYNAAANGIDNAEFFCGKAEEILPSLVGLNADLSNNTELESDINNRGKVHSLNKSFLTILTPDVIILDPPRAGCAEQVLKTCLQLAPKKIIMVSCNPATLARDIKYLMSGAQNADLTVRLLAKDTINTDGGKLADTMQLPAYTIQSVLPFDMFPQTPNVE
ncbi:MAG: 23S rRNA (uracil(1939)-C(5))-methyltransferase RlmD, partial [Clostridia bacterium]|nr:23S rRNA (uracil(1939)-C(5))-methyltransferase RlmD [Clostridia bacterium]